MKIKRSRIKGLRDAKKGYTPEVKAEIERDNNTLEALVRDSGRLLNVLKSNIRSMKSGLSFLGEGQKVQKAEIYDQIAQYEFDVQLLDTTAKIITITYFLLFFKYSESIKPTLAKRLNKTGN